MTPYAIVCEQHRGFVTDGSTVVSSVGIPWHYQDDIAIDYMFNPTLRQAADHGCQIFTTEDAAYAFWQETRAALSDRNGMGDDGASRQFIAGTIADIIDSQRVGVRDGRRYCFCGSFSSIVISGISLCPRHYAEMGDDLR
jgi:hypothetical protein